MSFTLAAGGALEITGPNGAGKSTLLRALAGLARPEAGRVRMEGGGVGDTSLVERCHYVGHADGLKGALTGSENLAFAVSFLAQRHAGPTPAAALAALGLPGLGDIPVSDLSAGQRRRVALARLLVAPRPLWVLDEPATALDTEARHHLVAAMAAHRAGGGLIVAATHAPLGLAGARAMRIEP